MIRAYQTSDKKQLIELLRLNIPTYFDESEEADFVEYLNRQVEDYFVVDIDGKIAGAGGINYFPDSKTARLSWDIVHPDLHGKGIGKTLTHFRIATVKNNPNIEHIVVRTSQLVFRFYEKMGFKTVEIEQDYWAKGFHLYLMKLGIID